MDKKRVQHLKTVWMKPDAALMRKAKSIAALKGLPLADIVHQALSEYVDSFFVHGGNERNQSDTFAKK